MRPFYDLAVNLPLRSVVASRLTHRLHRHAVDTDTLGYPYPAGHPRVLAAIAGWMDRHGSPGAVDRLTLTLGARHALSLALDMTCAKGDVLLMEALTYHGFRGVAEARGVRIAPVAMDEQGLLPAALAQAARTTGARTVYVQPTLHNPTTVTMPTTRRHEIAEVATQLGLTIIEGDVYGPLATDRLPSLASLVPEHCFHAGGIGKVLGPGLRVGWLMAPNPERHAQVVRTVTDATDGLPALWPAIVADWLTDGTADELLETLRTALRERNALARSILGEALVTADGLHAWLPCADAEGWATRAAQAGIKTTLGRRIGDDQPQGLRLSLATEEDPERLTTALRTLAALR